MEDENWRDAWPGEDLVSIVESLLAHGADPVSRDDEGLTPLSLARRNLPEGHGGFQHASKGCWRGSDFRFRTLGMHVCRPAALETSPGVGKNTTKLVTVLSCSMH